MIAGSIAKGLRGVAARTHTAVAQQSRAQRTRLSTMASRTKRAASESSAQSSFGASGYAAIGAGILLAGGSLAMCTTEDHIHPGEYPWDHSGLFSSYDHKALRRGCKFFLHATTYPPSMQQRLYFIPFHS